MIKFGIVGSGRMRKAHAEALRHVEGARLVGTADTWEQLIAEEVPDIVDIGLPPLLQEETVRKAAASGVHVLCRTPVATSPDAAAELAAFCARAGVRLLPACPLRFLPQYANAKSLIEQQAVGRVGIVRMVRSGDLQDGLAERAERIADSGRTEYDLCIHEVDWLRSCLGEVERVYAQSLDDREEAVSGAYSFITLRFQNGAIAYVSVMQTDHDDSRSVLEVFGNQGIIKLDTEDMASLHVVPRGPEAGRSGTYRASPLGVRPYAEMIRHAIDTLRGGIVPAAAIDDALQAARICAAAAESCTTGRAVTLR